MGSKEDAPERPPSLCAYQSNESVTLTVLPAFLRQLGFGVIRRVRTGELNWSIDSEAAWR